MFTMLAKMSGSQLVRHEEFIETFRLLTLTFVTHQGTGEQRLI